ncbi:SMR family transporter [Priestia megaterium]|uniref:DMT family transporter n=1 Tax=Priestia megaterium TaxID=1404 RepID=UPI003458BD56
MKWLLVVIAGILEVLWASGFKYASTLFEWMITFILILVSFILLIYSYKKIPVAAAYTVFVGIGTAGTYLMGIYLGDPFSIAQITFLLILLTGIVGMKTFTNDHERRGEQ